MPNEFGPGGGRAAAYADLVAAVLDLRSSVTTRTFDHVVSEAVEGGRLAPDLARELKWLQRQSLLDLVDHAERVLPTTIVALEGVAEPDEDDASSEVSPGDEVAAPDVAVPDSTSPPDPPPTPHAASAPAPPPTSAPPEDSPASVDLTSRRLLVAGLRTIEDRTFP